MAQKLVSFKSVKYVDLTHGDTPLHQACKQGWLDIVKLFIEQYGCDPNVTSKYVHQSLLHYACQYGHIDVVEYLINEQHLNPLLRDNNGLESLDHALNNNETDTAVYICQHCISSDEMLNPNRIETTINLIESILRANPLHPKWTTADGDNIFQLVGSSKLCISHMFSAVVLEILNTGATNNIIFHPDWKTADGDKLLELVCQSKMYLSQKSSALVLKWLENVTIEQVKKSMPDSKTADGETLIQLVCQSERYIAHVSTAVLSKWLSDTTLDLEEIIAMPQWKTADGDTLLQLICQSSTCLLRISSAVFLKWLKGVHIKSVSKSIPDSKTTDGITLLQLVLQSAMSISQTSSTVLSMWLSDSREISTDQMKMVNPNWKTLDGDHFLHILCQSKIEDKRVIKLVEYYIKEDGLNPNILDSNGNTALHIACQSDKPALVSFLLNEVQCDPNIGNKMEDLPLDMTTNPVIINNLCQQEQVAVYSTTVAGWMNNSSINDTTMVSILRVLVNNHRYKTKDGSTLLHLTCNANGMLRDKIRLIDYLLTEGHCDPNCLDSKGQMPLQLTSDTEIMKRLVENGAMMTTDVVFKVISSKTITDSRASELFTLSTRKQTMLWCPNELTSNNETALHLACKFDKPAIVNYLLTEAKCDPNANNQLAKSPLESTTNLEIIKILIKHGARVTPGLVLRFEAMETMPNKHTLIKLMLTTWNPDDRDSDGYTALHLACKAGSPTTVNLLLSVAHCDPNIKSNNEEVPLEMTTNSEIVKDLIQYGAKTDIMYESYQKFLGTNKPIEPQIKVFIVGNPSVGKSSLTAALMKRLRGVTRFFTSGKVSVVDQRTVGIVPHEMISDDFGRVTLHDFAGQREFYSGHAALLQTAVQSPPPIFLVVVNLCEEHDENIKSILYWITFLENQCASVSCKPHVILVGSHVDVLKGVNPKNKVKMIVDFLKPKYFINMELLGFVAMNCRYHESAGMSDLRHLLTKSCNELRTNEPITFNAHCFLVYLIDTFTNLSAVTINTVYNNIENQQMSQTKERFVELLPRNIDALYKVCLELNDRGHILLLKDKIAIENSYIVIDKEFLLSEISGTVFVPKGFQQFKQLSTNTGVVPLSKIAEYFPDINTAFFMGFLTHFEFCHEISDQALHRLISERYSQTSDECYYLFPGLISVQVDDTVWKLNSGFDYNFGWILQCIHHEQFFSSHFLQVLLLRLAFSFALPQETLHDNPVGIHRKCCLWKNGIFWGSVFHMQTLVEVSSDNKSIILLARFDEDDLLRCLQHRSEVIRTILQCEEQLCPRVFITESFVDSSSPLQYPLSFPKELNICTLQDVATAVVEMFPSVVLQCKAIPVKNFLSFEPYLDMKSSAIQDLWDEKNEKKIISEMFISTFVQQASDELTLFIKALVGDSARSTRDDDQLRQHFFEWRDGDMNNQKTYHDLRQIVDQYSVFAGRNLLVSVKNMLAIILSYMVLHTSLCMCRS